MSIVILDTETTGLPQETRASVIEIGAVLLTEAGKELGAFSSLIRPLTPLGSWCEGALTVNGIDATLLSEAPEPGRVWTSFVEWMALHAPITSVMAYNVSFDQKMMERTFPAAAHLPWGPCLMKAAAQHVGGNRGRIKLSEALKKLNVSVNPSAHRALFDAQAAAKVWEAVSSG